MNLLFLYGPPASGKLTVAKELQKLTGYPLLHNHLTYDLVHCLYPNDLPDHYDLIDKLRADIIENSAKRDTNLIYTYVYEGQSDEKEVVALTNVVENYGGKVLFIELTASNDVLLERVTDKSRNAHRKLTDARVLRQLLQNNTYPSMIRSNVLKVDASKTSPTDAALKIKTYFNLA